MKFNLDKLHQFAKPLPEKDRAEMEYQIENRDWLLLSVKLALRIRSLIREAGINQSELARRMDVSPAQISKILSGQENLSLKTIAKVEAALGQPLYQIQISREAEPDETTNIGIETFRKLRQEASYLSDMSLAQVNEEISEYRSPKHE